MDGFYDLDREMEARAALARAFHRSLRWSVLKDWWGLQRSLRRAQAARNHAGVSQTIRDINTIKRHYGDILTEALALTERSWAYREQARAIQERRRVKPGEMDELWQTIVKLP